MNTRKVRDPLSSIKKELKRRRNSGRRNPAAADDGRGGKAAIDQSAELGAEMRPKKPARSRRKPMATSSPSPFPELPDDLVLEILNRQGTLTDVVRSSSLLSKRWRNMWRLIGDGILDFDKSDLLRHMRNTSRKWKFTTEEKHGFADRVDQALAAHLHPDLDALKIGFDLFEIKERLWSWVELGFTKRVKQLSLICSYASRFAGWVPLPSFTPEFLTTHDLSRLEILEFYGISEISPGAIHHILSNCPSLQSFALRSCFIQRTNGREAIIRVCSSKNLRYLDFDCLIARIELISAPGLHSFKFIGLQGSSHVEFGDELPQLREALLFSGEDFFPWSRSQFSKFGPRLERLRLQVGNIHFLPNLAPPPEWLVFEKLRVLDLIMCMRRAPPSYLECVIMLRAAPMLRELSIWFDHSYLPERWERQDLAAESMSKWKHPSLEVLQLYGVNSNPVRLALQVDGTVADVRKCQLELLVYIIMSAPSLNQVLIDTAVRGSLSGDVLKIRLPQQIDDHIREAKMELETQLESYSLSPQINFTYQ